MIRRILLSAAFACLGALVVTQASADGHNKVTIGYQGVYNPWKVSIKNGAFEEATGYEIEWKSFDSGSKVINAMASGDVHIAMAGSSPIAAGVSRGLPIELFWIVEDIASAESLVARQGSGISAPQDLRGKKIGVPFVSTTHFHLLFALEQFGISANDATILNLQPANIAAAWERGDIDAAFVWDPALGKIKETGNVLVTSGLLSSWGKATFDGMVVAKDFGADHGQFMCKFVHTIAAADSDYRNDPKSYGPGTKKAKDIVSLVGGNHENVAKVLALYGFPTLEEQASGRWIGRMADGTNGGAARALFFTSEFLLKEKKIRELLPDYGSVVNHAYVKDALNGC
jgi:taurine transport system substrate-binding protein